MISDRKKQIVDHAYKTVPFYCDKKLLHEKISDWDDIPIVDKNDLVMKNNAFISENYLGYFVRNELIYSQTSGSTGKCVDVYWYPADCNRSLLPLWMRRKKYYNINPHDKFCYFFTGRDLGNIDVEIEYMETSMGICKSDLNEEKLVEILEKIREFGPRWMIIQPSIAVLLCQVLNKYNLGNIPTLKYIESTGEMLFPDIKRYIERSLGVMVANQYGCNELNSIALECPCGELHCFEENAIIEVIDSNGNSLSDGEEGELCITTLTNYAMPLIRYKVGDLGRIERNNCSCGCKGAILKLVNGRNNDWVIDRNGSKINAYVFARCVQNVNRIVENAILQFQIVQTQIDLFSVNLVLDDGCDPNEICNLFLDNLYQSSLDAVRFQFFFHSKLFPDVSTGKLQWFKRDFEVVPDLSFDR